jgi:predicted nucleic acid-binding protein
LKVALDSNILLYIAKVWRVEADMGKTNLIEPILDRIDASAAIVVPSQALGEAYNVMHRYGYNREMCRTIIIRWEATFETVGSGSTTFLAALDLAVDHKLQFWDALIVNAAADAGCTMLLSEDMQSGFEWRGVRVVNPFADQPDRKLARLLA